MKPFKLILFLILFQSFALRATIQINEKEIPSQVKTAFTLRFPNQIAKSWTLQESNYAVVFKLDGKMRKAYFDANGNYKLIETIINKNKLPALIHAGIASSEYAKWKISEVCFVENTQNISFYKVSFKNKKEIKTLNFDFEGNLMKD